MSDMLENETQPAMQTPGSGVRFALEATPALDAQKAARISQLATSLGLPENFVIENPRKAEMEVTARKLESNKMLAAWASEDRLNLALAKDDPALGEAMGIGETIGHVWDRETDALQKGWERGEGQRQTSRMGNRYLEAIGRGDYDAAAKIQADADVLQKSLNPLWEQEAFGLLKPGNLPAISQPLRQQPAKEYPPDKPLQAELDALFADTRIVDTSAGPLQQELDDLFSSPPHVYEIDGKAVLLPSLDENGKPASLEQAAEKFQQTGQHAGIFSSREHALGFLSQKPDRQREIAANWRETPEDTWVESALGPDYALDQLPRMFFDQIPNQANKAAWGAAGGFAVGAGTALAFGQAGPQALLPEEVVTVPAAAITGAAIGGKTGWIVGAGESAFYAERGAFALELARAKDANGNGLSSESIAVAANSYALLAAGVEMLSETFFLSLLKPLGYAGEGTKAGIRGFIRSAVKRAALDKGAGAAFLDGMTRLGANAVSEGMEEAVQESLQIFTEYLAKGYANQFQGAAFEKELFTGEHAAQIWDSAKAGAGAGLWLGGGPIIVSTALDVRSGRMAQAYSENLMALYDKVEASSTRQLSPAHMQSALEFSGEAMRETVALPADAALELYQKGTDILSPLGITEEQATKAAAQGQDFLVPVSRLPAYLDRQQMEAATQILRRTPDALNAAESARLDERVARDAAKVVELFQSQAAEIEAMVQEREALHTEVVNVIQSIPGLKAQAESVGGGVEQYVGDWLNTVERFSLRMTAAGQNPVDTFRRVAFTELRLAQNSAMPTTAVLGEDLAAMQPGARGVSATAPNKALVHTGVENVDDLYSLAAQSRDNFQNGISAIAEATGGQPMFRPGDGLKGRARTEEKILRDYPEIGAKRVLDILGGTILYDSRADVEAALPRIVQAIQDAGGEIVRGPVNRFEKHSAGYKDYMLNIRQPNGLVTELLLTTKAMNHAKTESEGVGVGHVLYEAMQKAERVYKDKSSTEEQKAEAWQYLSLLREASVAYYGSTGDQSNAMASLSGIVEPLQSISAIGASSANSSLYGELESLLGSIRNNPDSANINGLSSNSIKSLTNTGELGPSDSQGVPTASRPSMNRAINGLSDISEPPSNESNIAQDGAQNKDARQAERRVVGSDTAILLGAHGEQKARYEVRELADVIPSHDPENQFAKREEYPDNVQERPYHSDAGEQEKVRGNALRLDPRLVVNNNPDLTNGPPAITENGIVLGGNSRAMSIQLAYANNSERAQMYRNAIAEQADAFGLDASAVAGMENPILVRVVEGGATADMGKLARLYNQTMMQGLQGKAEGVSKARMISPETLEVLASDMADFDSLRAFFDSASSKRFMAALLRDGVLEQTQLSRLTEKNGRLNDAGKTLVENALRGMIVPDYDILSALPSSTLNKLDRVIPALAKLRARGEGWDMSGVVTAALRQVANANGQGKKVDVFLAQGELLETDPDKNRPAVQALALTFANATQKEVQARFELMAHDSARQSKGQNLLVTMPENTPAQSFQTAFMETIASVDGQSIAPFSPQSNPAHAALAYAYANGGKGHSVNAALEKLQKIIARKNATAEQKTEAKEMIRQLSQFSGNVAMYQPKLGEFFRHQPGQEFFHAQKSDKLGSTKIYPEGYLISLFKNANLSTLFHETGHIFFEEMERVVQSGAADQTMIRDYETMRGWLGAETGVPLTEDQREQVARGFEAYLMEGKAPTEDLKGAFSRFRRWLLKLYTDAANLDVELTDEVRGVFDRMLATEREIATTAARNELLDLTAAELNGMGFTGTARNTLAGLMPKARESATESLQEARDSNRKQRLAKYFKEGLDEVREEPVYRARSDMRKTPLDLQAVKDNYGEETAESLRKKTPGGFKNEGGVDPEIFALEHGFESGTDMITQMLNAPSQAEAVRQRVQEKEARHDAAYEAFEHLLETREVAVQMEMVGRKLAELLNVDHIEREAYMRAARQELSTMPLGRAMQTGTFLAAMRRALRQEREAINAGDRKKALEAHRKAMLNMEFVRESRDIAQRQGVTARQMKRFIGMSKGDPDARFIVMDIGMRHGLNKFDARLGEGRDTRTIQDWLAAADGDGYSIFPDDRVLFGPGAPWREMSVSDFESLAETVAQIVTVERNRRQIQTAQGKQDLQDVADTIAASIYSHRNAKALKTVEKQPVAVKSLKGLHAIHTKIEALCIALDGDNLGVAWEFIYKPINDAEDRQSNRFRTVRDALRDSSLFGAYTRKELAAMGGKRELVQEVGEKLTHENRIAVALNMGNEANISRVREGHGWNDSQIGAVLRTLTKRDWEFVQAVWDYIGSFKDEAFALQEQVTGLKPTAVEAQAFTVQTADGHSLNLRGGYYPIKYDSDKGFLAFQREQRELDKELFGGRNYGAAMTKNGHLKERAEGGAGSPLLLELSVITDHIFNTVHDLEYRRAVLDVAKVIRHKTVRDAIESTVGMEMYRELLPWLQDVAQERQEPMHQIHRWARWARASASIMQMGYKVTTMLAQPMGFTQSIELLGYKDAAAGLKIVYGNPLRFADLLEETFARSTFMENRIKSFDREVRDFTKQLKPGMGRFAWVEKAKENAFVPMGMFQMSVDLPTWWGAYQKGLRENGGNESQAAQYADSTVRMSQGGGATKDLARVQRGGDLLRMFTMFYSYFNTMYNLGARRVSLLKQHRSPKDIFVAANTALLLWFVPAVLSELVAGRGPEAEGEEPDEWLMMNLLQYPFQSVVGVRDVANAIFGNYGYQLSPAQSAPKSLVNWFLAVNKAIENEDVGEMAKPTAEAVGYIFGLPMKQPIITVGNLWDYLTGNDPEFALRDLIFVKPKDRR